MIFMQFYVQRDLLLHKASSDSLIPGSPAMTLPDFPIRIFACSSLHLSVRQFQTFSELDKAE
ncbi:MAG TPA: hypothetical protein DCP64_11020 [Sarcina sp.]|nr:hypothetical protein [Sarcina sp.]